MWSSQTTAGGGERGSDVGYPERKQRGGTVGRETGRPWAGGESSGIAADAFVRNP